MTTLRTALLIGFVAATTSTLAQTPPAQTPAPQTPPPQGQTPAPPRTAPRPATSTTSTLAVQVTDKSGNGIQGVAVAVAGPVERSGQTGADGSISFRSLRAGTYRLRFEHERYITLERELVMRGASEVAVALNPAPVKPVVAPPPPPPQAAAPPEQRKLRPVEPRTLSVPDFLEQNFIRSSEPQKTSLIACTDAGAARILQIKEPLNNQQNDANDVLLYIIASASTVRVKDQTYKVDNGWFALIPRGVSYSIARAGRNPVMAMTVAMGAPCTETGQLAR